MLMIVNVNVIKFKKIISIIIVKDRQINIKSMGQDNDYEKY